MYDLYVAEKIHPVKYPKISDILLVADTMLTYRKN